MRQDYVSNSGSPVLNHQGHWENLINADPEQHFGEGRHRGTKHSFRLSKVEKKKSLKITVTYGNNIVLLISELNFTVDYNVRAVANVVLHELGSFSQHRREVIGCRKKTSLQSKIGPIIFTFKVEELKNQEGTIFSRFFLNDYARSGNRSSPVVGGSPPSKLGMSWRGRGNICSVSHE